jgi:hypothetical protein
VKRLLLGLALLAGCVAAPDPVDNAEQGIVFHTFDCDTMGPPQGYGWADVFSAPQYNIHPERFCMRIHGSVDRGSSGQGFKFTPGFQIRSIQLSTVNTRVIACGGPPNGPSYAPCSPTTMQIANSGGAVSQFPNILASSVVVGFQPVAPPAQCPYVTQSFPRPATYQSCGDFADDGLPRIVAKAAFDTNPIVGNISTGQPCVCPADSVIPTASECVYSC